MLDSRCAFHFCSPGSVLIPSEQIFIADLEEVESLPRHATMAHLEKIDSKVCMIYLEHIIITLGEAGSEFHEKLIELYLNLVRLPETKAGEEKPGKLTPHPRLGEADELMQCGTKKITSNCWISWNRRHRTERIEFWVDCPRKICSRSAHCYWVDWDDTKERCRFTFINSTIMLRPKSTLSLSLFGVLV